MLPTTIKPIHEIPLTAESREQLLRTLFHEDLVHPGEVFVPDDSFYSGNITPPKRAHHMVRELCQWLGVKPGYISLQFEFDQDQATGSRYTIFIETSTAHDEFKLGAFLALALTHYLVEERKQVRIPDLQQQTTFIADASVVFGLGLVVLNGLHHSSELLQGFPRATYAQLVRNYVRKYRIEPAHFSFSLTPWATRNVAVAHPPQTTRAIRDLQHHLHVSRFKLFGLAWALFLILSLSGYTWLQRVKPLSPAAKAAEQRSSLLENLAKVCEDQLLYNRQYADQSDIQTLRALSANELRCQSLRNQYEAARQNMP